ncbi:hypothetical protein M0812_03451 [Anaeramoeba flamelloides]|uniref:Uncharacterized protein n=1 Tax=Anaeramoeba flamelloides TaxID=1746091 RepID=A0AAV8AGX4_9EUKA|nr:hypothetical protein M0812_03451 [Anaeramoeba flamelloides]
MQNLTFSEELLTQDVDQAKIEFEGITSFRKRLKVLKKWRPKGVLGLDSACLKKSFLKRMSKNPLSEPIKIKRDCILDLVMLTRKPKKSIERGLSTFFKKYYLLHNISNYSREWLVFGPEGYSLDPKLIPGTSNLKKKNSGQSEKKHKRKKKQQINNRKKIKQSYLILKNQKKDQAKYENQNTTKRRINNKHKNKNKNKKNQSKKQKQKQSGYLKYKNNYKKPMELKKTIKFKTQKKYQIKKKKSRSFKKGGIVKAVKLSKSKSTIKICFSKLDKKGILSDSMKNFEKFDLIDDHYCKNINTNEKGNFGIEEENGKETGNQIVENKKYIRESEDLQKNSQKLINCSSTSTTNPRKRLYKQEFTTLAKSSSLNNLQTSHNNKNVMGEYKKIKPNNVKYEEYLNENLTSPQETPISSPQSSFSFSFSSDNDSELFSDIENDSELDQLRPLPYFQILEQNDELKIEKKKGESDERKNCKVGSVESEQGSHKEQEKENIVSANAPENHVKKYFYNNELNGNFIHEDNNEIIFEQNDSFWDGTIHEEMEIPIFDWFESTNPLIVHKNEKFQKHYHPHLDFDLIGGIN